MPPERLSIPLHIDPTRQAAWRVVGALGVVALAAVIGYAAYRTVLFRNNGLLWPNDATSAVRVIKTPTTQLAINAHLAHIPALDQTPWTIGETFAWTNREYTIFFSGNAAVGVQIDGKLPDSFTNPETLGVHVTQRGQKTLISLDESDPTPLNKQFFAPSLIWPGFNGAYYTQTESTKGLVAVPLSLTTEAAELRVRTTNTAVNEQARLHSETVILASLHATPEQIQSILPEHVPLTFPGVGRLSSIFRQYGSDILLGSDERGVSFVFTTNNPNLTLEEMGGIARELLQTQLLSTVVLTMVDGSYATEIVGPDNVEVVTTSENGLNAVTAKDDHGNILRLTQSENALILSNREPVISPTPAINSDCLARSNWFIKPKELQQIAIQAEDKRVQNLFSALVNSEEIAGSKNAVRICW